MELSAIINLVITLALFYYIWSINQKNKNGGIEQNQQIADKISIILAEKQNQYQKQNQDSQFEIQEKLQKSIHQGQIEILTKLQKAIDEIKSGQLESQNSNEKQMLQLKLENQKQLSEILEQIKKSLAQITEDINKQNSYNFDTLNKTNQDRLNGIQAEIEKKFQQSVDNNLKSFQEVVAKMKQVENSALQMLEATKPMDKLVGIFERTNSKAFGSFAEDYLQAILEQHLNQKSWERQKKLEGSSEVIDFVINFGNKKIGIDVKFPLTTYDDFLKADYSEKKEKLKKFFEAVNYNLQSIANKYSKTGKLDHIIMYMPSDGMYAEVSNSEQLLKQFAKFKIRPASPATILPIISLIQEYQQRLFMHTHADDIIKGFKLIRSNFFAFGEEYRKLGDKLNEAQGNYSRAGQNLKKIDNQLLLLDTEHSTEQDNTLI
jgi:DNA anti-recombination protein RmuC